MMQQSAFIVGKKVIYCAAEEEDFTERLRKWRNDPEVTYFLFQGMLPSSGELLKEEYEHLIRSKNDVILAIVDKQTGTRIGITGYYDIDWITRHGELRILIGEKEFWGKGYGNEIMEVMFAFGFSRLNLNKVRSGVNTENTAAIKYHERLNCVREGTFRKHQYRHGKYYDAAMFGIFRDEFIVAMKRIRGEGWSLEKALSTDKESQSPKA